VKQKLIIIAVALGFLLYLVVFPMYKDYTWAKKNREEFTGAGYVEIHSLDNFSSLTAPWSIIRPPVTSLWFAEKELVYYEEPYLVVPVANLRYEYFGRDEVEYYIEIYNTDTHQNTYLQPNEDVSAIPEDKEWFDVNESQNTINMYNNARHLVGLPDAKLKVE